MADATLGTLRAAVAASASLVPPELVAACFGGDGRPARRRGGDSGVGDRDGRDGRYNNDAGYGGNSRFPGFVLKNMARPMKKLTVPSNISLKKYLDVLKLDVNILSRSSRICGIIYIPLFSSNNYN